MSCKRGCCASQKEHFRSVAVAPRFNEVGRPEQRDVAMAYDMASYKAMRSQGLQPPHIAGCYDLARRATSEAEIRLGTVISDKDAAVKRKGAKLLENALEISDHGMIPKIPEKGRGAKRVPIKVRK